MRANGEKWGSARSDKWKKCAGGKNGKSAQGGKTKTANSDKSICLSEKKEKVRLRLAISLGAQFVGNINTNILVMLNQVKLVWSEYMLLERKENKEK